MIDNFENSKLLIIYLMMTDNNLLWVVFLSHSGGVRVSECGKEEIQHLNRTSTKRSCQAPRRRACRHSPDFVIASIFLSWARIAKMRSVSVQCVTRCTLLVSLPIFFFFFHGHRCKGFHSVLHPSQPTHILAPARLIHNVCLIIL